MSVNHQTKAKIQRRIRTTAYNIFIDEQVKIHGNSYRAKAERQWGKMSRKQKEVYRKEAKEQNDGIGNNLSIPAELQISYMDTLIENLMNERSGMRAMARDYIENVHESGKLDSNVFCILSISNFYEDKYDIFPCELALAKFSLEHGVMDSINITINPGALPKGSTNEAQTHSKESHQYAIPKETDIEDNYIDIMLEIVHFLKGSFEEIPIFFTEGGHIDNRPTQKLLIDTKRALVKIFEKSGEYTAAETLQVVPLPVLLYYVHRCICNDMTDKGKEVELYENVTEAHNDFYANQIHSNTTEGCEFHYLKENLLNCCLSKVRRFGYAMAALCSQPEKYSIIEGSHYPMGYKANV